MFWRTNIRPVKNGLNSLPLGQTGSPDLLITVLVYDTRAPRPPPPPPPPPTPPSSPPPPPPSSQYRYSALALASRWVHTRCLMWALWWLPYTTGLVHVHNPNSKRSYFSWSNECIGRVRWSRIISALRVSTPETQRSYFSWSNKCIERVRWSRIISALRVSTPWTPWGNRWVYSTTTLSSFKSQLKTFLFSEYFS